MTIAPAAASSFTLFSIGFGGPGSPALPMRDLVTNIPLDAAPEWVASQRSAPVACPQGATLTMQVVFQASNVDQFPMGESYTVQATSAFLDVSPQAVAVSIQPMSGFSAPATFSFAAPVPQGIGVRSFTLDWTATDSSGHPLAIGTSSHTLYVTWQQPPAATVPAPPAPYQIAVQMAVQWAAGETTVAGIAAALLKGIDTLHITRSFVGSDARMALLLAKADSVGFTSLLNQMLWALGIVAVPRAIAIDWSHLPADTLQWVPSSTAVAPSVGGPEAHCLSLIASGPDVLFCDAEAGLGPVAVTMPLPPDAASAQTGGAFAAILAGYLKPAAARLASLPTTVPSDAPIEIFSVHFAFPQGNAIALRDAITDGPIGVTPEWVAGMDSVSPVVGQTRTGVPAAFVRGTTPTLEATFLRTHRGSTNGLTIVIGADGTPASVAEQTVTLTFGPDGRSAAVQFTLDGPISAEVAATVLTLKWYAKGAAGQAAPAGTSTHPVYVTWKPMTANPAEGLPAWSYSTLVQWTSTFAAGAATDKDVCDRVFANLSKTGLKYGVAGWNTRQMLLGNGGMCGGWYQLFQAMLHCQGVLVEKRAFLVNWRTLGTDDIQWNAIVVSAGGLNQQVPPVTPSVFHDLAAFPIPAPASLTTTTAQRYRFWGLPGGWSDGHCINFFTFDGALYLYDASFSLGPIPLAMPLPPADNTILGGADLESFVANYLVKAVSHMLGSFAANGQDWLSVAPAGADAGVNGISVVTSDLPTMVGAVPAITFGWI
jgi:hypothetical protein